ncbi:hypothetical protein C8F04DRAFT_1221920 [Mycena alexandri]|uniref:Major facilitator superfamily (MFS) profile domain-containing protein n=1 Tax=Mycena alexandri TaxID=1745969 RepID=A0AAD6SS75_9AGAR|nr:hypothetical protein C8F04DRAFT_1221920 [Mycena alexandri]
MSTDIQQTLSNEKENSNGNEVTPALDQDAESGVVDDQQDGADFLITLCILGLRKKLGDLVFSKGWKIWMLYGSMAHISFLYALSETTTSTYEVFAASSFKSHSLIGAIAVVVSITSGIAQPFLAKITDFSSRGMALSVAVLVYAVGYIVVASSTTIQAVASGEVIYGIGNMGIDLMTSIILADITSLQWRGFMQGLYSMPFVITAFVTGNISTAISANTLNGWRWGYGMFIILIPISITPAVVAKKIGGFRFPPTHSLPLASSSYARRKQLGSEQPQSLLELGPYYWRLIDAFSLLLLGAGFALILLPFTLYTKVHNAWKNPSLIAMFVVGGVLLITFVIWEIKGASHPIMPRRVMNRTFLCSILINFMTFLSSTVTLTYFSSYVYVVKDWSVTNYTYFNNIMTVGLSVFAVLAGLIQRVTHRYKYLQLSGLCIRLIGQGLTLLAAHGNKTDAVLVMSQILTSLGAAFSIIGSAVALQASVPHQDLALVISLLALWDYLSSAMGNAISAAIWTVKLPQNLDKYLGDALNSTEIAEIYGSIIVARLAEPRDLVIKAYNDTAYYLFLPVLCLSTLSILAACFTTNFYLGTTHNAIESKEVRLRDRSETHEEVTKRKAAEIEARFKDSEQLAIWKVAGWR